MPTSIIHINTGPRSGKTTLGLAMLKAVQALGADCIYVAPTRDMAEHVRMDRRPLVPVWHVGMIRNNQTPQSVTCIVLDDVETIGRGKDGERIYNDDTVTFIQVAVDRMSRHRCPTQLIILHREN